MSDNWLYKKNRDNSARYILGEAGRKPLVCVGINPSTAEPNNLDRTLTNVRRFSELNGYDGWLMLNVYPQRSTRDTLIIYHHLGRNGSHDSQIKQREYELQNIAGQKYEIISLKFSPYSPRAYFVITNQGQFISKIDEFVSSNWKQCFELVE